MPRFVFCGSSTAKSGFGRGERGVAEAVVAAFSEEGEVGGGGERQEQRREEETEEREEDFFEGAPGVGNQEGEDQGHGLVAGDGEGVAAGVDGDLGEAVFFEEGAEAG